MWFKNIHFYKFEDQFKLSGQQLHEVLETRKARRCGHMELSSQGWYAPLGNTGQMLVHESEGNLMICLRREDKVLPASLVREQVEDAALTIEQEMGRPVGRKEKRDLKDKVLQELMPKALVRSSYLYAAILPKDGWLIINSSSAKGAEELIELLRKTLGSLNVVVPATDESPESAMTRWLQDDQSLPVGFTLEDACEMRFAAESESIIRCSSLDLSREDIRAHVAAGYQVKRLALNWQGRLSFMLHDDLSVRRMRFDSAILDEAGESGDDEASRFDVDFTIMAAELAEFLPQLLASLQSED